MADEKTFDEKVTDIFDTLMCDYREMEANLASTSALLATARDQVSELQAWKAQQMEFMAGVVKSHHMIAEEAGARAGAILTEWLPEYVRGLRKEIEILKARNGTALLIGENAILRKHVAAISNEHSHEFAIAINKALEKFMTRCSPFSVLQKLGPES